jgi:DNA-binding transcriptional LysR family regulator
VYLLPDLIGEFCASGAALPALTIGSNPAIAAALDMGALDVALLEWWDGRAGFHSIRWREESIVGIAAPDHPWADLPAISIAKLAGVSLIGGEIGTGTGRILRDHLGSAHKLQPPIIELSSTEAVKRAVCAGLGVSVVMKLAVREEEISGRLIVRPLTPRLNKLLYLVWRDGITTSHPLIAFLHAGSTTQ